MNRRFRKLRRKIERAGGIDILLAHAPAAGIGDGEDLCHKGFEVFNEIIETYKPSYFLHGHQHLNYNRDAVRLRTVDQTQIINGYEYHMFDYEDNGFTYESNGSGLLTFLSQKK